MIYVKNHDKTITLSMVVAFFVNILSMLIVWLNVNEFISISDYTQNGISILGMIAFFYMILVLIMIVSKMIKNGKSGLEEEQKTFNRSTYNKMFAFNIIGICVILMSFYLMMNNLILI